MTKLIEALDELEKAEIRKNALAKSRDEILQRIEELNALKYSYEHTGRMLADKKKIIDWVKRIIDNPKPEIEKRAAEIIYRAAWEQLISWGSSTIREAEKL